MNSAPLYGILGSPLHQDVTPREEQGSGPLRVSPHSAAKCQFHPGRSLPSWRGGFQGPWGRHDLTGACRDLEGSLQAAAHTPARRPQLAEDPWEPPPYPEQLTGCVASSGSCYESVCLPPGPRVTVVTVSPPGSPRQMGPASGRARGEPSPGWETAWCITKSSASRPGQRTSG